MLAASRGKWSPYEKMGNGQMDSEPTLSLHSWPSRSFTSQERMTITALFHAIASSRLLPSLQNGYAMPPRGRNGADAVVVQHDSNTTLVVIMPYGTLLLSLQEELDAFSAELATNFIRTFMERWANMAEVPTDRSQFPPTSKIGYAPNPISSDGRLQELEENEKLLYALREIAETSDDAESVRVAFIALSTTTIGQAYLKGNPIRL